MEEQKKDVATQEQAHVPAVPGRTPLGMGHEDHLSQDDFEIPRAKIVQFSSDEAKAADPKDRIAAGVFISNVSKKELSSVFIPIRRMKAYTKWNARQKDDPDYDPAFEAGALIFSTKDRHDPRIKEGDLDFHDGATPKVDLSYTFLALFEGQRMPMLLTFTRTSLKFGKRLNTLLDEAGGDMFSNKFKLKFKLEDKGKGAYYTMEAVGHGKATDEEYKICKEFYLRFTEAEVEKKAAPVDAPTE